MVGSSRRTSSGLCEGADTESEGAFIERERERERHLAAWVQVGIYLWLEPNEQHSGLKKAATLPTRATAGSGEVVRFLSYSFPSLRQYGRCGGRSRRFDGSGKITGSGGCWTRSEPSFSVRNFRHLRMQRS